ncbi:Pr6Pr family membrane protein [uncultured Methylobacterium sp.]|uniref:Pr6Pr family membrane protein n=1 Tax=uncultured Methylobacterium sp. TaxID=157278 RepID=UPI0035C9C90D
MTALSRLTAAAIASTAWAGLGIQFASTYGRSGSMSGTLWAMLRYFTVTTNLAAAILLTGLAASVAACVAPRVLAGIALAMGLVGIVYHTLLRGLLAVSGGDAIADRLLHAAMPVMVPLFWLAFVRKGALGRSDPFLWLLYPALYWLYALARGLADGRYAYPFLDAERLGWGRTALNGVCLALGFLAAGFALVGLDATLGRRAR